MKVLGLISVRSLQVTSPCHFTSSRFSTNIILPAAVSQSRNDSQNAAVPNPEADQLLQRSIVPTMHFQKSLPRLPIPKLEKTIERYLKAQEPLLTSDQLKHTQSVCRQFMAKEGQELNEKLVKIDKSKKHTSYISDLWFDMYLVSRSPLVINFNPFIAMNDDLVKEKMDQTVRAADLTFSALRFRNSVRTSLLEPDVYHMNPKKSDNRGFRRFVSMLPSAISWYGAYLYKAFPLDMSQYENLFNSTRIPKPGKDVLYKDESANHIAVLHSGIFYTFDVYDKNGNILPAKDIKACYEYIIKSSPAPSPDSIAVLSGGERDHWAKVRQQLITAGNEPLLRKIDSAIFTLCLDTHGSSDIFFGCKNMLHGDGYNRWFDKSFSLIVDKVGRAAVNFEHAWGDGVAVLRFVNEIYKDSKEHNFTLGATSSSAIDPVSHVSRLDFKITPDIRKEIDCARQNFDKSVDSIDLSILEYGGYGKEEIKQLGFYPDSVMQLAFQMAYYRVSGGQVAPTYESCSTAAFKHGRTECIRSATNLTKQLSELIVKDKVGPSQELRDLLKKCSDTHGQLTKEAAMGNGFDRHLFALRKLAELEGKALPIFTDEAYARMNHNILSTSTLQSPAIAAGGFAPVVPDGYGLGYSCMDHTMGCVVFYFPQIRSGKQLTDAIQVSFDDLMKVMSYK